MMNISDCLPPASEDVLVKLVSGNFCVAAYLPEIAKWVVSKGDEYVEDFWLSTNDVVSWTEVY